MEHDLQPADEIRALSDEIERAAAFVAPLREQIARVLVGQDLLVGRLLVGLLANGHVLIEGVPGLGKTLAVRALAAAIDARFQRIQFTPDLLPADLIGTQIFHPADGSFSVRKGPVFAHIVLADEINRAPAKVQSALLEAMQERRITIGEESFPLPDPFLVLATENPIEQEGTYPLPEAQVDRFLLKVCVKYPAEDEERRILSRHAFTEERFDLRAVVTPEQIRAARAAVNRIHIDKKVVAYILRIVAATRTPAAFGLDVAALIRYGASPRASLALTLGARAQAFLDGRGYVTPQDVKSLAPDVLRHRILMSFEAEAESVTSADLVDRILETLPVP